MSVEKYMENSGTASISLVDELRRTVAVAAAPVLSTKVFRSCTGGYEISAPEITAYISGSGDFSPYQQP
jgi:hypothetical protein